MLQTKADFRCKDNQIETKDCIAEKVIRLSGSEFDRFSRNLLSHWDFIRDNQFDTSHDADGRRRCLLVVGEGRRDGIEPLTDWRHHLDSLNESEIHASEIIYKLPDNTPARYLNNGTFIFTAYGCALTERQTKSGMYVYTAINLTTGTSVILSRRKRKLDEDGFPAMAAKIGALPFRGKSRLCVDKKPGESARDFALIETSTHIFKEILPQHGYAVRENQVKLAEHILDVTGRRGITLAERKSRAPCSVDCVKG